jgi:hypothetical protein
MTVPGVSVTSTLAGQPVSAMPTIPQMGGILVPRLKSNKWEILLAYRLHATKVLVCQSAHERL